MDAAHVPIYKQVGLKQMPSAKRPIPTMFFFITTVWSVSINQLTLYKIYSSIQICFTKQLRGSESPGMLRSLEWLKGSHVLVLIDACYSLDVFGTLVKDTRISYKKAVL